MEKIKNKAAKEWFAKLASDSYSFYQKNDSTQDTFKNLCALYLALFSGFLYVGTAFPLYYSDGHLILFYLPYAIGFLLMLASFIMTLKSFYWRNPKTLLAPAEDFYSFCSKVEEQQKHEEVTEMLNDKLSLQYMQFASQNQKALAKCHNRLHIAGRIGCVSFLLLMLSTPRLITTKIFHNKTSNQIQNHAR